MVYEGLIAGLSFLAGVYTMWLLNRILRDMKAKDDAWNNKMDEHDQVMRDIRDSLKEIAKVGKKE